MNSFNIDKTTDNWFSELLRIKFDKGSNKNILHKIAQISCQEVNKTTRKLNHDFYLNYFQGYAFHESNDEPLDEKYQHDMEDLYDEEMSSPFPDDNIMPIDCFFCHTEPLSNKSYSIGGSLDITKVPISVAGDDTGSYKKNFLLKEDFNNMFELFGDFYRETYSEKLTLLHRIVDTITLLANIDVTMIEEDGTIKINEDELEIFPLIERDTRITASYYLEFLIKCFEHIIKLIDSGIGGGELLSYHKVYIFDRFIENSTTNHADNFVNFLEDNHNNSGYKKHTGWIRSGQQYQSLHILEKILSINTCILDASIQANLLRFAELKVQVNDKTVLTSYSQVQNHILELLLYDGEIDTNEKGRYNYNNLTGLEFAITQYNSIFNKLQNGNGEKQGLYERLAQDYSSVVNLMASYDDNNLKKKQDIGSLIQQKEMSNILNPLIGEDASFPQIEKFITNSKEGPMISSIKERAKTAADNSAKKAADEGKPNYPKPKMTTKIIRNNNTKSGGKKNKTKKYNKKKNKKTKRKIKL